MDPTSGTATMLGITQALGEMYKKGTLPHLQLTNLKHNVYC
jgi:hypothetical protein